jgi:hypothetical protein
MTLDISATSPRVQYTVGGSSTTTFAYGFPIFQEADLKVYVDSTLKTLTTHYSVTGEGTTSGGNVVFGSGLTNCTVTIFRDVEIARTTDFPTSGSFQVGSLNTELDTITAVQQELEDKITRSVRLDDEDSAVAMTLPLKADRIGKILGFNSSTGVPESYVYLTNENTVALDGLTAGTVLASKYVLVDSNKDIGTFRNITLSGELDAGSLDVSGDADIDGTLEANAITIGGVTLAETIADTVGAMVSSNTETGITVSYEDGDNTLDFVIGAGSIVNSMLADDAVGADELASNAVVTASIVADAVTGAKIADDQIDSEHYVDGSIDGVHIANDAIDSQHYAADSIDTEHYAAGSVDATALGADAVTAAKIGNDVINSEHYAAASIDNEHLADDAVDSDEIAAGAIDLAHMSVNSIDSDQYVDGSIDTAHIADGAITGAKIAAGTVVASDVADDAITTAKILNSNVTLAKMAANSIDSNQYVDGSIDLVHMSANSVDSDQYVDGSIDLVHMSANSVDSDQYVDGSIDTAHIANDQITNALMADDAIDSPQLANGSVDLAHMSVNSIDSDQYVDGSIDTAHIGADQITSAKIADDQIDSEHIAAGAVDAEHMSANSIDSASYVDGSIDLAHMSANSIDSDQYVDGSIDLAHMSANSVDSDQYVDGSIDTAHVADNAISLAKMAGLARGKLIYGDASGDPAALTVGGNGTFLKSDGTDVSWGAATVSGLAADDLTTGDAAVTIATSSGAITIDNQADNADIIFKGTDGGADITALTLDMSNSGTAIFNKNLNLASDASKIKFGVDGEVTLTHVHDTGLKLGGTTPTLTIGDAGAEDTKIVFDGNAQDYHIGLDDTDDSLKIGLGSTLGTTPTLTIDTAGNAKVNDGNLVIGTAGHGIDFSATANATTNTSELFSDYEEGTWVPSAYADSGGFTISSSYNTLYYSKIGRVVCIYGYIYTSAESSPSGALIIGNLPYTSANTTTNYAAIDVRVAGISADPTTGRSNSSQVFAAINPNTSTIIIKDTTVTNISATSGNWLNIDATTDIYINGCYMV